MSTPFCPIKNASQEHVYVINTPPLSITRQESSIQIKPNVRDKNGNIIKPNQYENHLEKNGPVMVNVFPMI